MLRPPSMMSANTSYEVLDCESCRLPIKYSSLLVGLYFDLGECSTWSYTLELLEPERYDMTVFFIFFGYAEPKSNSCVEEKGRMLLDMFMC